MTIENPNYRQFAGFAGSVTQPGATIKSAYADTEIAEGLPVKLKDGKAVVLEAGDKAENLFGIAIKRTPFATFDPGQLLPFLHEGYIQVPIAASVEPVRGGQVFYDPTASVFTTDNTKVAVRAIWSADGQSDGVAEIQVVTYIPTPAAAAA